MGALTSQAQYSLCCRPSSSQGSCCNWQSYPATPCSAKPPSSPDPSNSRGQAKLATNPHKAYVRGGTGVLYAFRNKL